MKVANIKGEVTHDIDNLRKKEWNKYKTQWKATPAD
jgi:hypothetical protein